jgi:hypothetical protein
VTNVAHAKTLHAYGTLQGLESGHHILLFLYFDFDNLYYAGNPASVVSQEGWRDEIFVGGTDKAGQHFTLYLVDVGPQAWAFITGPDSGNDWIGGFPSSYVYGQGDRILDSITFTSD